MENYGNDVRMNGDIPNVPVTTLSGLASLTQLLPELPLPGPLPGASSSSGSSLLFHQRVEEEAKRVLNGQNPHLAQRLAQALSSTQEPYLELRENAGLRQSEPPNFPLVGQVLAQNPSAFGSVPNQGQAQWNQTQSSGHVSHHYNNDQYSGQDVSGWQQPNNHSRVQTSQHSDSGNVLVNGNSSTGSQEHSYDNNSQSQHQQSQYNNQQSYKIPRNEPKPSSGVNKNFKIDVNTLSKADQALMQKSLKELKFGEGASYNNFSPRARKKDKTYKDRSDSESSEDEDGNPKPKSKFFKHTEKERLEEKQKRKEERKKRHEEGDDYDPSDDNRGRKRRHDDDSDSDQNDDSWLKRRRVNEPESSAPPSNLDNFVPKKVTRKVEKKYLPEARKLDSEEILESTNFVKFSRTMELIFETAEEVNMGELNDADDDDKEIPTELLVPKYQAATLASESAKLKTMSAMAQIPTDRLVKILSILSWKLRMGHLLFRLPLVMVMMKRLTMTNFSWSWPMRE